MFFSQPDREDPITRDSISDPIFVVIKEGPFFGYIASYDRVILDWIMIARNARAEALAAAEAQLEVAKEGLRRWQVRAEYHEATAVYLRAINNLDEIKRENERLKGGVRLVDMHRGSYKETDFIQDELGVNLCRRALVNDHLIDKMNAILELRALLRQRNGIVPRYEAFFAPEQNIQLRRINALILIAPKAAYADREEACSYFIDPEQACTAILGLLFY